MLILLHVMLKNNLKAQKCTLLLSNVILIFLSEGQLNQMTAHDLQLPWQKESFITVIKDLKYKNPNPLATRQQIEKSLQIITYFKQILWLEQHLQMGGLGNVAPPYLSFCFADNLCA